MNHACLNIWYSIICLISIGCIIWLSQSKSVCLGITKSGTKNFKISVENDNLSKNSTLNCYIILSNSSIHTLKNCEWSFSNSSTSTQDVTVSATYILKNNDFYSKRTSTKWSWSKRIPRGVAPGDRSIRMKGKLRPFSEPSNVTERTAKAIMINNSPAIMIFVTRSTPLRSPEQQTIKPIETAA